MPLAQGGSDFYERDEKKKRKKKTAPLPTPPAGTGPSQAATEAISNNRRKKRGQKPLPTPSIDAGTKEAKRRRKQARVEAAKRRAAALAHLQQTLKEPMLDPWHGMSSSAFYDASGRPLNESERKLVAMGLYNPDEAGFIPGLDTLNQFRKNAIGEASAIARGTPAALYTVGNAIAYDFQHPHGLATGENPFSKEALTDSKIYSDVIKPQGEYYKGRYYDPIAQHGLRQGLGEIKHSFFTNPVSGALDVVSVASAGTGAAAKVGLLPKVATRTVRIGDAVVHPPSSPNWLSAKFEHLLDDYSNLHPDNPLLGAKRRGAKTKASQIAHEQTRTKALAFPKIKAIRHISFGKVKNARLRRRLYYESQLPPEARNVAGIEAIAKDLEAAGQTKRANRLRKAATERVPAAYREALDALRSLTDDAERIYAEAGVLTPEIMEARRGLISRRVLGEEAGPSDIYMPHVSKPGRKSDQRVGASRVTGSPVSTAGIRTQKNRLKLWESGRERPDPDVAIENWFRAQTLDFHSQIKKFFWDAGEDIGPEGPHPGWYVVNPEGKATPALWKDVLDKGDPNSLFDALEDYVRNYIGRANKAEGRLIMAAAPEGVRQVDPLVVRQFFNRLAGPQGAGAGLSSFGGSFDVANSLVKMSLLYANPGYIPSNLLGNLAFGAIHQGPFLVPNLVRAAHDFVRNPEKFRLIVAEVGAGPTVSLAADTSVGAARVVRAAQKGEQRVAHIIGSIPDAFPRAAAWYYEARKAGFRTDAEQLRLLKSPDLTTERNQIRAVSNNAMVSFEANGPIEKSVIRRIGFVYPWLKGATKYPLQQIRDRPVRSALGAHAAEGSAAQQDKALGDRPSYFADMFQTDPTQTGPIRNVINPASISPINTPFSLAQRISGTGESSAFDLVNPLIQLGVNVAKGQNQYGADVGYGQAFLQGGKALSPAANIVSQMRNPPRSDVYVNNKAWDIFKRRVFRFLPQDIYIKGLHAKAESEKKVAKTAYQEYQERLKHDTSVAKKYGAEVPQNVQVGLRAKYLVSVAESKLKDSLDLGNDRLSEQQKAAIRLGVLFEVRPDLQSYEDDAQQAFEAAKGNQQQTHEFLLKLEDLLGYNDVETFERKVKEGELALLEQQATG